MVFLMSALLVLIRQFGIILPICFAFSCLFLTEFKWKYLGLALLMNGFVFLVFKSYESFLKTVLEEGSTYKFSGNVSMTKPEFWKTFYAYMIERHTTVMLHVLLYALPFIVHFHKGPF